MWWITIVSLVGLLLIFLRWAALSGNWRRFGFQAVALMAFAALLYAIFSPGDVVIPKGDGDPDQSLLFMLALYLCMLLGMLAQFLHRHFERPTRRRRKFDWGVFIAPVFASPVVFIPLLVALQNAQVDLERFDTARIMIFLVAFQNGFFWKDYFDQRQREVTDAV